MTIDVQHVSFQYPHSGFGVVDISMTASSPSMIGVIGANGSGKTTLLKLLCGLLPCTSGDVVIGGTSITSLSYALRAKRIAYLPQSHRPAFEFTVEQAVLLGRIPHRGMLSGFDSEADIAAADAAIDSLELQDLRLASITELSGGELQRVMIARTLAQQPQILVLDEPHTHLDIQYQYGVLSMLRKHCAANDVCVIASLHDLNLASMFCDYLAVLSQGRLLKYGTPAETLTESLLEETFGIQMDVQAGAYIDAPALRYRHNANGGAHSA